MWSTTYALVSSVCYIALQTYPKVSTIIPEEVEAICGFVGQLQNDIGPLKAVHKGA